MMMKEGLRRVAERRRKGEEREPGEQGWKEEGGGGGGRKEEEEDGRGMKQRRRVGRDDGGGGGGRKGSGLGALGDTAQGGKRREPQVRAPACGGKCVAEEGTEEKRGSL